MLRRRSRRGRSWKQDQDVKVVVFAVEVVGIAAFIDRLCESSYVAGFLATTMFFMRVTCSARFGDRAP